MIAMRIHCHRQRTEILDPELIQGLRMKMFPVYRFDFFDLLCFQGCDVLDGTPISVLSGSGTPDIDFALRVLLFADGFESGDTTAWSRQSP